MDVGFPPAWDKACAGRRGTRGGLHRRAVAVGRGSSHVRIMPIPHSPLDEPVTAAHAWARYKRIMGLMAWITLAVVIATLALLFWQNGFVSINFFIATALGVGGMMLLTAALMGLVFLSSGTGHDASVINPLDEDYSSSDDGVSR